MVPLSSLSLWRWYTLPGTSFFILSLSTAECRVLACVEIVHPLAKWFPLLLTIANNAAANIY